MGAKARLLVIAAWYRDVNEGRLNLVPAEGHRLCN